MPNDRQNNYLEEVGIIIQALEALGLSPILIGGMALVILGSQRVTQDFDFIISKPNEYLPEVVQIFYQSGMELVSKLNEAGAVINTIDNQKVAEMRIRIDQPISVYFYNISTGLRLDLLFDFPIKAVELANRAKKRKILSQNFTIADTSDLLRLKKIAKAKRSKAGDTEDLVFLKTLLKKDKNPLL